jgi:hypothetical protein
MKKKQYATLINRRNQDKTIGLMSNGNTSKGKDLISSNSMLLVMQLLVKSGKNYMHGYQIMRP